MTLTTIAHPGNPCLLDGYAARAVASWVIVNRDTGNAVFETFDRKYAEGVNGDKYRAVPIAEYLGNLNRAIRKQARS